MDARAPRHFMHDVDIAKGRWVKNTHRPRRFWSGGLDSNQRPLDPQSSALPNCATTRKHRSFAAKEKIPFAPRRCKEFFLPTRDGLVLGVDRRPLAPGVCKNRGCASCLRAPQVSGGLERARHLRFYGRPIHRVGIYRAQLRFLQPCRARNPTAGRPGPLTRLRASQSRHLARGTKATTRHGVSSIGRHQGALHPLRPASDRKAELACVIGVSG